MNKIKKILATTLAAATICVTNATTAFATGSTGICIGVNYIDSVNSNYGNFRTNASNAKSKYNSISGMTALWYATPTKTKISNHINDTVVFLNSHANYDHIRFVNDTDSPTFDCGVKINSGNTKYVGLDDQTLSNTKLISFVGCLTAESGHSTNLVSNAVAKGADTAVGFTDTIHSRSSDGPSWLNAYNEYLAQGRNVGYSIYHATSDYSNSDLGTYASIGGFPGTTIASATYSSSGTGVSIDIPVEFDEKEELTLCNGSIELIANKIREYDASFDSKEYRVTQNIFSREYKTGIVKFDYYIGDFIKTNRAYVVYIEDGIAKEFTYSLTGYERNSNTVNEEELVRKIHTYSAPESIINTHKLNSKEIVKHTVEYTYNYKTNELSYSESVFYYDEPGGVVVDDYFEEKII